MNIKGLTDKRVALKRRREMDKWYRVMQIAINSKGEIMVSNLELQPGQGQSDGPGFTRYQYDKLERLIEDMPFLVDLELWSRLIKEKETRDEICEGL